MIVTTTQGIEDKKITDYLGIVSGADTYLMGGAIGLGVTAKGQTLHYTSAVDSALLKMVESANDMSADAIVGIEINTSSSGNGTIAVTVSGTAVKLKDAGFEDELPDL